MPLALNLPNSAAGSRRAMSAAGAGAHEVSWARRIAVAKSAREAPQKIPAGRFRPQARREGGLVAGGSAHSRRRDLGIVEAWPAPKAFGVATVLEPPTRSDLTGTDGDPRHCRAWDRAGPDANQSVSASRSATASARHLRAADRAVAARRVSAPASRHVGSATRAGAPGDFARVTRRRDGFTDARRIAGLSTPVGH